MLLRNYIKEFKVNKFFLLFTVRLFISRLPMVILIKILIVV